MSQYLTFKVTDIKILNMLILCIMFMEELCYENYCGVDKRR